MYCSNCGNRLADDGNFCSSCGHQIIANEKAFLNKPESRAGNTSGQGNLAAIPQEIKGWSWGGFLLNWIWGIGNSVWIALLCLIPIPIVIIVMAVVVGVKGNEWAWQSRKWDSVESFKATQRKWAWWGLALWIVVIVFFTLVYILDTATSTNSSNTY